MFLSLNFFRHDWVDVNSRDYRHESNAHYVNPETGYSIPMYRIWRPRQNERYVSKFRVYRLETLDLKRDCWLVSLHKTIYDAAIEAAIDFNRKMETLPAGSVRFVEYGTNIYQAYDASTVERFMKKLPDKTVTSYHQNEIGITTIDYEDRIGIM